MKAAKVLVLALLGMALLRLALGDPPAAAAPRAAPPALPHQLQGHIGQRQPLAPSERRLAASPDVTVEHRTYHTTQVALVTTTGVKELHPPAVCLAATGHEVVLRREELSPEGCLVALTVRHQEQLWHYYYTYFNGRTATCDFWWRAATSAWARLSSQPTRWSTVQVMDRDPRQARVRIRLLLRQLNKER